MGNVCNGAPLQETTTNEAENDPKQLTTKPSIVRGNSAPSTFGKDPLLNRLDYIFSGKKNEKRLLKMPGSINGQQFLIEECENCDIYVLDHCTGVQIDQCNNCRIFIGPCDSSLFMRNCNNCTLIAAVHQLRTRDCKDIDFYLYSATQPSIETSTKLRFACFPITYFSLHEQFEKAKLSIWNNRWSEVYDFTPTHANWKLLSAETKKSPLEPTMLTELVEESASTENGSKPPSTDSSNNHNNTPTTPSSLVRLWDVPAVTARAIGLSTQLTQLVVPLTAGRRPCTEAEQSIVICFISPRNALVLDFAIYMAKTYPTSALISTRQMKLTQDQAAALFLGKAHLVSKAKEAATHEGSIILEFRGPTCYEDVKAAQSSQKFTNDPELMSLSMNDKHAKFQSDLVFNQWREKV